MACRRCGVPIVAIATPDESDTLSAIVSTCNGSTPVVVWDLVRGIRPGNDEGRASSARILGDADPMMSTDPAEALSMVTRAPDGTVVVMLGGHRLTEPPRPVQAIINLRDTFKTSGRTLVLVGPAFRFPPELSPHVESIDIPLPDEETRTSIVRSMYESAGVTPDDFAVRRAVASTRGLPAFGCEQAVAMAMRKEGLDLEDLRARWKTQIRNIPGLSVDDTKRSIDDLGGLESAKAFALALSGSKRPPSAILLLDEGGKMLAGGGAQGGGDTSGVSQGIEASLLTHMQDTKSDGQIAFGVPGSGKSACAQLLAACLGVPLIRFDLSAVKGSLVGESERNMRTALNTINALVGGSAFWVLTCNEMGTIKPEIRRRFRSGIWFFDVPNATERESIRQIYCRKYAIDPCLPWPDMTGWTGAEIETCAERADQFGIAPIDAAQWIVPVTRSSQEIVDAMRRQASGRYLSASYPGPYTYAVEAPSSTVPSTVRRFGG